MKIVMVALLQVTFILHGVAFPNPTKEQSERFWQLYGENIRHLSSWKVMLSSRSDDRWGIPAYCELEKMGPEILPLVYQAWTTRVHDPILYDEDAEGIRIRRPLKHIDSAKDSLLGRLSSRITRTFTCHLTDVDFTWKEEGFVIRWQGGDEFSSMRTRFLLDEMRAAHRENRPKDEYRAKAHLAIMGIFAFPILFSELENGRDDVLVVFSELEKEPDFNPGNTREALLSWWRENRQRYALPKQSPNFKGTPGLEKWKRLEQPKSSR